MGDRCEMNENSIVRNIRYHTGYKAVASLDID